MLRNVFRGNVVRTNESKQLEILNDVLLGVDHATGNIAFIEEATKLAELQTKFNFQSDLITHLSPTQFLMPGLIDAHVHGPQYPNCGLGLDLPLLDWLQKYTFPTEARFADAEFAKHEYDKVVRRFLRNGTTTACYFASIHLDASIELANAVARLGQRAFVGKVNMDRNSPDFYVETTEASLQSTRKFVEVLLASRNPLVQPIITPRFVPTCTPELMHGLAKIAREFSIPIQSHVSENKAEIEWVKSLHPDCPSYTAVYDKYGLLTPLTILAHGVHLEDSELALLKERGTAIIHCPNSNFSICSGICNVRRLLAADVKVGMGTDCSGGYAPSMLDSMRQGFAAARSVFFHDSSRKPLEEGELLYYATVGSAQALGLQNVTGNLVQGLQFDALLVDMAAKDSPIDIRAEEKPRELVQRFLFCGDDRNIAHVFVAGRSVVPFA
eukprot:TRINITY_DN123_c0_g1_i1.p1 TRINITY_DN123_c0_g1~~TRINITY_DN123_c0_g1_i1.p1  ORF type:complete len:441 (-),score=100.19 TRINITY_DN123_c0_g1_i1:87-1409(-)